VAGGVRGEEGEAVEPVEGGADEGGGEGREGADEEEVLAGCGG
jgi:hypothetical protein